MNQIIRFHQSLTNINFEMFVCITSENQQRQQLLQRLLGIFPRPNFFTGKNNCCSYPMSFHDKDVNRDRNFKLINFYLQLFQWHVWKQLASVNFLFVEIAKNFGIATERKLTFDSSTFFTSKFDPNWDLNFKTVLFDNKFNALLLWKPSWLQINRKNQHLTPFFTGPNIVERDFLFTLNAKIDEISSNTLLIPMQPAQLYK